MVLPKDVVAVYFPSLYTMSLKFKIVFLDSLLLVICDIGMFKV